MGLPPLTHLQFAIVDALGAREKSGRELRQNLTARGIRKSGPAFYQLMARLEDAGFVKGWYDQKVVEGQIIKERRYRLMGAGAKAFERTLASTVRNRPRGLVWRAFRNATRSTGQLPRDEFTGSVARAG